MTRSAKQPTVPLAQAWIASPRTEDRCYFGLESGGQFGSTFSGLPPLCTVGAAESDPPASGNTALFSMAMELAVFSSPLPVVAAGDVVHAVSGLSLDAAVDCATAVLTLNIPARIAAATRIMLVSEGCKQLSRGKRLAGAMVPECLEVRLANDGGLAYVIDICQWGRA